MPASVGKARIDRLGILKVLLDNKLWRSEYISRQPTRGYTAAEDNG